MDTSGTQSHRGLPPGCSQEHTSSLHNRCLGQVLAGEAGFTLSLDRVLGGQGSSQKLRKCKNQRPRTSPFLASPRPRKGSHHYLIGSSAPTPGRRWVQAWNSALGTGGSRPPLSAPGAKFSPENPTRHLWEGHGGALWPGLTLVDGVLGQLAELAVDHPRVGAQKLLLAGRQLQG